MEFQNQPEQPGWAKEALKAFRTIDPEMPFFEIDLLLEGGPDLAQDYFQSRPMQILTHNDFPMLGVISRHLFEELQEKYPQYLGNPVTGDSRDFHKLIKDSFFNNDFASFLALDSKIAPFYCKDAPAVIVPIWVVREISRIPEETENAAENPFQGNLADHFLPASPNKSQEIPKSFEVSHRKRLGFDDPTNRAA